MKVLVVLAAAVVVALAHPRPKAALHGVNAPTAIEGEYIVVFKKSASDDEVASHKMVIRSHLTNHSKPDFEMKMTSEWKLDHFFRGYAAKMCDDVVDIVREMPEVAYVETNQEVKALQAECTQQTNLASGLWGLERTTLKDWNRNDIYSYDEAKSGEGIEAFIIDTGIDFNHPDFGGRIDKSRSADFIDSNGDGTDYNGHGTHCAGTVLADTYGLAKKATGVAVRVLNANGSGTFEQVISGVVYTGNTGAPNKSTANMSLGGGLSTALNDAVAAAVAKGVHFAVAAGNEYGDACTRSPASTPEAVTVGASDDGDIRAAFSNTGTCVDIFAPGVAVLSTYLNGGTSTLSGTSMASPHVCGVMVKLLAENGEMTPAAMKAMLTSTATPNMLQGIPSNTPNLLLFDDCE